ncbi:MAG TPA: hypothetical protein VFW09_12775 [Solirubrobacteraceae bacterium]|nr:hypothetical protein [Solirubrobacteraceae bacterium]
MITKWPAAVLELIVDELATRLASRVAEVVNRDMPAATPLLNTREAIEYSRMAEGTFRKLAASGKIPSHGGKSKLFYRPELDQALMDFTGIAEDERELRQVR